MITITITIPPNTTVTLPPNDAFTSLSGQPKTITIENQSGQDIDLNQSGSATSFSVDNLPASIVDGDTDTIDLTFLATGTWTFTFGSSTEIIFTLYVDGVKCAHVLDYSIWSVACSDDYTPNLEIVDYSIWQVESLTEVC